MARIGGSGRTLAEVLAVATASGDWPRFCSEVERGVALEADRPGALSAEAVRGAVRALRRTHGLLSRADLRSWLEDRDLGAEDLSGVARRALLRDADDGLPLPDPPPLAVGRVLWAEIACAAKLADLVAPLALGVVAERRLGHAPPVAREEAARVERLLAGDRASGLALLEPRDREGLADRACGFVTHGRTLLSQSVDEEAIGVRCRERALDWRLLELEELSVPHDGAAREALLQARVEGRALDEMARAHGFDCRRVALRPEERPGAQAQLRSAATGDLLGPAPAGEGSVVMRVLAASSADTDPELRERAARELAAEAAARLTAGLVSWRTAA